MASEMVCDLFRQIIDAIEQTQTENIEQAAEAIVDSVTSGGAVHIFDTGHLVDRELVHRAGGLALYRPLRWDFSVSNPVRFREGVTQEPVSLMPQLVECALDASRVSSGDVVVVGSVSGKSVAPVGVALGAQDRGAVVVGITAVSYSRHLESEHPSGKRLYEVADMVIDNQAPYGDASLTLPRMQQKMIPSSGVGAVCALWALSAEVACRLSERGLTPSVYQSINRPDTEKINQQAEERYQKHGW